MIGSIWRAWGGDQDHCDRGRGQYERTAGHPPARAAPSLRGAPPMQIVRREQRYRRALPVPPIGHRPRFYGGKHDAGSAPSGSISTGAAPSPGATRLTICAAPTDTSRPSGWLLAQAEPKPTAPPRLRLVTEVIAEP